MCDVRLSTFAQIILRIAQYFISPRSLVCLFELSELLYFWQVKVDDSRSKADSVLQRILTLISGPDCRITVCLCVLILRATFCRPLSL